MGRIDQGGVQLAVLPEHLTRQAEVHSLRLLVVELSRVYFDQDEDVILHLHEQLKSDTWPEWQVLESDAWGARGGADPSVRGPVLTEEGLTGNHEERVYDHANVPCV